MPDLLDSRVFPLFRLGGWFRAKGFDATWGKVTEWTEIGGRGVLDLGYASRPGTSGTTIRWSAFARWAPAGSGYDFSRPDDGSPNAYSDPKSVVEGLKKAATDKDRFAFWLFRASGDKRFAMTGADALAAFDPQSAGVEPVAVLPLEAGEKLAGSGLLTGDQDGGNYPGHFRLQARLPLPVGMASKGQPPATGLPITSIFRGTVVSDQDAGKATGTEFWLPPRGAATGTDNGDGAFWYRGGGWKADPGSSGKTLKSDARTFLKACGVVPEEGGVGTVESAVLSCAKDAKDGSWAYSAEWKAVRTSAKELALEEQTGGVLVFGGDVRFGLDLASQYTTGGLFPDADDPQEIEEVRAGPLSFYVKETITDLAADPEPVPEKDPEDLTKFVIPPRTFRLGGIAAAVAAMAASAEALVRVEAAPQSFLPRLTLAGDKAEASFVLRSGAVTARLTNGRFAFDMPKDGQGVPKMRLTLEVPEDGSTNRIPLMANFPGIAVGPDGMPVGAAAAQAALVLLPAEDKDWGADDFARFRIGPAPVPDPADFAGRLGGLRFDRPADISPTNAGGTRLIDSDPGTSWLAFGPPSSGRPRDGGVGSLTRAEPPFRIGLHLSLRMKSVRIETSDLPRGDRRGRSAPLVIGGGGANGDFLLRVTETLAGDADRQLKAELFDPSKPGEAGTGEPVRAVLSFEPFSLVRVDPGRLAKGLGKDSTGVATYDSDTRTWLYPRANDSYRLTYPPAVVGEASDKPGFFEILDPEEGEKSPVIDPRAGSGGMTVALRYGPPTTLWVRPEDLARDYSLPPWEAPALFRQRGDFGPGVGFDGMTGEFLYGLSVGIDASDRGGPDAGARVAEIEVTHGRPRAREDERTDRAGDVVRAIRARPERLEVWRLDPSQDDPFVPARFGASARFALRNTALHRAPVLTKEDEVLPGPSAKSGPRFAPYGLPGGALWPIESRAVLSALLAAPEVTGGSVGGIALSQHGGSADAEAQFLSGVVRITSETRNGRVERQRVEVLGRIAAIWHKARHVIVYARTTAPSAQFAPDDPGQRTARPVLRKVAEYIELIQQDRGYPDQPGQPQASVGCLRAVSFGAQRIAVDGSWGGDLPDGSGYTIPLWNRHAAAERPTVYKFPSVAVFTAAEGAEADARTGQDCLDPDQMCFVADLAAARITSDSDRWPARAGIDGTVAHPVDVMNAVEEARETEAAEKAKMDGPPRERDRRAAATLFLPGFRRFTWRLGPSAVQTRINAGRGDKPIYSGLASVTFMREVPGEGEKEKENVEAQLKAVEGWRKVTPEAALDGSGWGGTGNFGLTEGMEKAEAKAKLIAIYDAFVATGLQTEKGVEDTAAKFLHGSSLKDLSKFLVSAQSGGWVCDRILADAMTQVRRQRVVVEDRIASACRGLLAEIDATGGVPAWAMDRHELEKLVADRLTAALTGAVAAASGDIGRVRNGVAALRAIVADWEGSARAAILRTRDRIDALAARHDRDKPWSARRILEAAEAIDGEISSLVSDAEAALDEMHQRFASEAGQALAGISSQIEGGLARALAAFEGAKGSAEAQSSELWTYLDKAEKLAAKLRDFDTSALAKAEAKLRADGKAILADLVAAAIQKVDAAKQAAGGAAKLIADQKGAIEAVGTRLADFVDAVSKWATDAVAKTNAALIALSKSADALAKAAEMAALQVVNDAGDTAKGLLADLADGFIDRLGGFPPLVLFDRLVAEAKSRADRLATEATRLARLAGGQADVWLGGIEQKLKVAQQEIDKEFNAEPDPATGTDGGFRTSVIKEFATRLVAPIPESLFVGGDIAAFKVEARAAVTRFPAVAGEVLDRVEVEIGATALAKAEELCKTLAGWTGDLAESVDAFVTAHAEEIQARLADFKTKIDNLTEVTEESIKGLVAAHDQILSSVNALEDSGRLARGYANRALDAAAQIGKGGAAAVPGNALRLYSMVTSAPEIAALKVNADRIRATLDKAERLMSPGLKAAFDRIGDALKAMGIDLPFNQLSDRFEPDLDRLRKLNLGDLFPSFGGMNLKKLLPDAGLGGLGRDAVRISHDFDKAAARAWLRIDVKVPLPGRKTLFRVGPFAASFRDARFTGFVQVEASKDKATATLTDAAEVVATVEMAVGGTVIVSFVDLHIRYSHAGGLDVDFDPRKIRLNPSFRFVQDFFGAIGLEDLGALKLIREGGIPVGVEHEFLLPSIDLMAGTSGITNLQIGNRFSLRAYPEFVLGDRFDLSREEMPFIFSIFIIGGTGYVRVDAEYKPLTGALAVSVEAAAGGSAALAFAFGPVKGAVFIAISAVLRYRRVISGPGAGAGGGLTVSLLVVIAGNVSLWGIVTIYIGITLRLSYHDDGRVDGVGTLRVSLRISKFIKLKYSTTITYRLRGSGAARQVTSDSSAELEGKVGAAVDKANKLNSSRKALAG
jgi:hypothetical protein